MIPAIFRSTLVFLFAFLCIDLIAQTSCPGFPSMVQRKVPNLTIGTYIKGFLEYTPAGYNPGGTQRYPLIIYFHGVGEVGPGTNESLCSILGLQNGGTQNNPNDVPLPERIELGQLPAVTNGGTTYNYVVLSPQYNQYSYPGAYPSAADVEAMIDYAVAHYKVDVNRIYLTGMSSGSNMIMEYVGTSLARAQRVAAIAMASECSSVGNYPNGPSYIATANLAVWEVHCNLDDNPFCNDSISSNWITKINTHSPPPIPLAKKTTLPVSGWPCNTGFTHNTWNTLYNPSFTDGGTNVYQWLIQYARSFTLPVLMKNYSARLENSKVIVEWTTVNESKTDRFILERAGSNLDFQPITAIAAAGFSSTEKKYLLVDEQPNAGINFYRLSVLNVDGRKEYFDIKKLNNPTTWSGVVNIPNPVKGLLGIYLKLDRSERIRIQVLDLNGRLMKEVLNNFNSGVSENRIDVSSFAHGTYLVRITGESISINKKIIIN